MEQYLEGIIIQQRERARALIAKIPRQLPREFNLLIQTARRQLNEHIDNLNQLYEDAEYQESQNQRVRVHILRRITRDMNILETVAITALSRIDENEDVFLNRLVDHLCRAINFPLLAPITTTLSSDYFHIFPTFNLIRVPLLETRYLLHLPDLLHELAHPFFFEENDADPSIQPIRDVLEHHFQQVSIVLADFKRKQAAQLRGPGTEYMIQLWEESWITSWGIEFICDLFAVYSAGPAFVWSHLYLVTKLGIGGQPFSVPQYAVSSHPADHARLDLMLRALRHLGFGSEAALIGERWQGLLDILDERPGSHYEDCYPEVLLQPLVEQVLTVFQAMGCRAYQPNQDSSLLELLNTAWTAFWNDPNSYVAWEKEQITQLTQHYLHSR